jgi:UDP-N-acetylmuramoyl-L-alanyl-D-glutamate--2,6-diaminopimelate ligase
MARWFVDRLPQRGIPAVSLRGLIPEARFLGCADWEVSGCSDDHRRLEPGQLFVAVRGARPGYDGHAFVREALDRGAAGVVVEHPCPDAGRLQVVVPDAMAAHARICHALAGDPSQRLLTIGVTGSFGRTLTAVMARSILEAAGQRAGLLGGLGFHNGTTTRALGAGLNSRVQAGRTARASSAGRAGMGIAQTRLDRAPGAFAPCAAGLAALLSEMVDCGCNAGVIEVASEAMVHRSFEGVAFQAAVVTDVAAPRGFPADVVLERRRAKARLVRQVVPAGMVVINADDPNAEILGAVNLDATRVGFGLEPASRTVRDVDVRARLVQLDSSGTRLSLMGFDREAAVHLRLVSPRAATCALAAAALGWALQIDRASVVNGLESVESVAGHLESISAGQDFDVRVDASQTPDALHEALSSVRAMAAGQVHCVLSAEGCGDRAERRRLAEAAEAGADRVILTLSNPRTEDPNQILDDLLAGFRRPGRVRVEPDRRHAIESALADAGAGDTVLIVGKGHHTYQILADRVLPFDDAEVVRRWLVHHAGMASANQRSA